MNRQFKRMFALVITVPILMLSACIKIPGTATPSLPPAPSITTQTASPSPAPAEWHSGVKTDYAGLTPYKPPEEKYTRLKAGAMPELIPDDYGRLLPYVGETMYSNYGYASVRRYGLMTAAGMIVTDPVYARVYQGSYYDYGRYTGVNVPFFSLTKIPDDISRDQPWDSEIYAVCAADGSWVTPFEYQGVFFTDELIMLVRSREKNDIDIMDHSGKILYNTTMLGCYSDIPDFSEYRFQTGYGEGLIAVALTGGRTVFIDARTGAEIYTDYEESYAFSGGLAAVKKNGLFGYINRDFSMVIEPQFIWADFYQNGKCIVQYPDNSFAILDQGGSILMKNPYYISRWDAGSYSVSDAGNNVTYYDGDLQKISFGTQMTTPLYNGWFATSDSNSIAAKNTVTIYKGSEKHTFKGVSGVNAVSGSLAAVYINVPPAWQEGVMTLGGEIVIPMAENQSISLVTSEKTGEIFAIASSYNRNQSYKVYKSSGEILFSGNGYAGFNASYDLFEVNDELSYAYIDTSGKDVFRISLMKYVPD